MIHYVLLVTLIITIGSLWLHDVYAQQKQYDLDSMNFADLPPYKEGEAILMVGDSVFSLGFKTYGNWSGEVTGSDSVKVPYNGSGKDIITFPCTSGNTYSIKFRPTDRFGFVDFLLTDSIGINLVANTATDWVADNSTLSKKGDVVEGEVVSLSGTCGILSDDEQNLIEFLYLWNPDMITPAFLGKMDTIKEETQGKVNVTGNLMPEELHEYLIKTPDYFPPDEAAMLLVRYGDSWSGQVVVGGDGFSIDGRGDDDIGFWCAPGEIYSVSVHKLERDIPGPTLRLAVITNDKILDIGETDARYGSVSLSGTC